MERTDESRRIERLEKALRQLCFLIGVERTEGMKDTSPGYVVDNEDGEAQAERVPELDDLLQSIAPPPSRYL